MSGLLLTIVCIVGMLATASLLVDLRNSLRDEPDFWEHVAEGLAEFVRRQRQ